MTFRNEGLIHFNGHKLFLASSPFDNSLLGHLLTKALRIYKSEWRIESQDLYLVDFSGEERGWSAPVSLKDFWPRQEKVLAEWVTGKLELTEHSSYDGWPECFTVGISCGRFDENDLAGLAAWAESRNTFSQDCLQWGGFFERDDSSPSPSPSPPSPSLPILRRMPWYFLIDAPHKEEVPFNAVFDQFIVSLIQGLKRLDRNFHKLEFWVGINSFSFPNPQVVSLQTLSPFKIPPIERSRNCDVPAGIKALLDLISKDVAPTDYLPRICLLGCNQPIIGGHDASIIEEFRKKFSSNLFGFFREEHSGEWLQIFADESNRKNFCVIPSLEKHIHEKIQDYIGWFIRSQVITQTQASVQE